MITVSSLQRPGLGPIDFSIKSGECLAITGPSGSGKSLLLRALVDLDPNEGTVQTAKLDRRKVAANIWRQSVALLPAESGWWAEDVMAHFTDQEATRLRLPSLGLPGDAMDWQVARLSSGERHRLALLRLLETTPDVLLLDEPTAALDQKTTEQVEDLLKSLLAKGMTLLLVTHDPEQPARMSARTLHLEKGVFV